MRDSSRAIMILQGPHQVAEKMTTRGTVCSASSSCQSSASLIVGMASCFCFCVLPPNGLSTFQGAQLVDLGCCVWVCVTVSVLATCTLCSWCLVIGCAGRSSRWCLADCMLPLAQQALLLLPLRRLADIFEWQALTLVED